MSVAADAAFSGANSPLSPRTLTGASGMKRRGGVLQVNVQGAGHSAAEAADSNSEGKGDHGGTTEHTRSTGRHAVT